MKKISILCFSLTGYQTGAHLAEQLNDMGYEVLLDGKSKYIPGSIEECHVEWTGRQFEHADAIIFIGACGIAIRSIAPFVKSKKSDPAVIVLDECGKFVISLLSGHLGGANELTELVAEIVGGTAVVTTATDIHGRFAVDVFARKNECEIFPMDAAKALSAALLAQKEVGFYSDFPYEGELPKDLTLCDRSGNAVDSGNSLEIGVAVGVDKCCHPFPVTVHVVPRIVTLGLGCRKGKEMQAIQDAFLESMKEANVFVQAFCNIASIDLKKEEPGILAFAKRWKLPFVTFSEEELRNVEGCFTESAFVEGITGVDNVCERSCVLASGNGTLIQKKTARDGVTTALAIKDWSVHFE